MADLLLVLVGVTAGFTGAVAGIASVITYPALLAFGLSPISANVTGAVATLTTAVGSVAGSRVELRGQLVRTGWISAAGACGAAAGVALLLLTPESVFERTAPWLLAAAAVTIVLQDRLRRLCARTGWAGRSGWLGWPAWLVRRGVRDVPRPASRHGTDAVRGPAPVILVSVAAVGLYAGYFAATAGVLMLAVLSVAATEPLAVSNAVKNAAMGAVNLTAAAGFAVLAPVEWRVVGTMAAGCLVGSWLGPAVVRRLPERPLRLAIGVVALAAAAHLWYSALE